MGHHRHRRAEPTPTNDTCCTATPSGTSCGGCADALGDADTTYGQDVGPPRNIKAAIGLLDWLAARGMTLATHGKATWTPG